MKILILKDKDISKASLNPVLNEVADIYQRNAGITISWFIEEHDFTDHPIEEYRPGDPGIAKPYLKEHAEKVYTNWREGVDLVVFMPHQSHWKLGHIWGWNISNVYSGYEIEQVRFDAKNSANTIGTLYHEIMHSHDSFIYRYTGINVDPLLPVNDWDADVVHGGGQKWDYIRHKENQEALAAIRTPLKDAFMKRRSMYDDTLKITLMKRIIQLAEQVIELQRRALVEKNKKTLPCYQTQIA